MKVFKLHSTFTMNQSLARCNACFTNLIHSITVFNLLSPPLKLQPMAGKKYVYFLILTHILCRIIIIIVTFGTILGLMASPLQFINHEHSIVLIHHSVKSKHWYVTRLQ